MNVFIHTPRCDIILKIDDLSPVEAIAVTKELRKQTRWARPWITRWSTRDRTTPEEVIDVLAAYLMQQVEDAVGLPEKERR